MGWGARRGRGRAREVTRATGDICWGWCWGWPPPPPLDFWAFFCIRQWILNQLERLPYLQPDLDIPTERHFLRRQALQDVLFLLSMTQM